MSKERGGVMGEFDDAFASEPRPQRRRKKITRKPGEKKAEKPWPEFGEITKLTPTARDQTRLSIHVDGKYVTALSQKEITRLDLHVGQTWDSDLSQKLRDARNYDEAFRYALGLLGKRAYSRGQVKDKLWRREVRGELAERVLDRLEELKYLDDQFYAEAVIRELQRSKPAGARFLKQKLIEKRVAPDLAEKVANEAAGERDAFEDAYELAAKKWWAPSMQRLEEEARVRRIYGQLARRGFDGGVCRAVVEKLKSQDGPEEEAEF